MSRAWDGLQLTGLAGQSCAMALLGDFLPLPQGQGSFRPTCCFGTEPTTGTKRPSGSSLGKLLELFVRERRSAHPRSSLVEPPLHGSLAGKRLATVTSRGLHVPLRGSCR